MWLYSLTIFFTMVFIFPKKTIESEPEISLILKVSNRCQNQKTTSEEDRTRPLGFTWETPWPFLRQSYWEPSSLVYRLYARNLICCNGKRRIIPRSLMDHTMNLHPWATACLHNWSTDSIRYNSSKGITGVPTGDPVLAAQEALLERSHPRPQLSTLHSSPLSQWKDKENTEEISTWRRS